MKNLTLLILACLLCVTTFAQTATTYFYRNNFKWTQTSNGMLFNDIASGSPGLEIGWTSGQFAIFAHNLIFAGVDSLGEVRSHFQSFCQEPTFESCESVYGPLKIGGGYNADEDVQPYNRFWFVTRLEVDAHLSYYECVNNPDCDASVEYPGYEVPIDFVMWPAEGDVDLGYAEYLAPFVDFNGDGAYNAIDGDYPNFCGDFTSYQIYNDVGTEENSYAQGSVGLEIHTQIYGYDTLSQSAVYNTLFIRQKVINRSNETYTDCYLGNFTDFDLGNPSDDYIGTDVARSMYYAYNGDSFDENSESSVGFLDDLPAIGMKYFGGAFLDDDDEDNPFNNGETYGHIGSGWGDGIIDNERHGLTSTVVSSSGGPIGMGLPIMSIQHYNFLQSIWNEGVPVTFEGNGFNPDCSDCLDADYSFPGDSDPLNFGTDGVDPNYGFPEGWTEGNSGIPPGDRRVIAGSGPFTFAPGDSQTLDYAVIFARESHDEGLTVIETLQQYADEIVGMQCGEIPDVTLGIYDSPRELEFKVFPNPATDVVNIELPGIYSDVRVEMLDMQSRVIYSQELSQTNRGTLYLDVAKGQYILRITADGEVGVSKLTKM